MRRLAFGALRSLQNLSRTREVIFQAARVPLYPGLILLIEKLVSDGSRRSMHACPRLRSVRQRKPSSVTQKVCVL